MREANKRIIIATGIFPPESGGPATYSMLLARELQKEKKDFVVITYSDDANDFGFRVIRISKKQNILKRYLRYFLAVFSEASSSSTVYAQDPMSSGLPALFSAKLKGARFLLKVVGDYAWEQGSIRAGVNDSLEDFQKKRYGFFVSLMKILERFVAKRADVVITPSEFLKKIVKMWGVNEDKIKVIYNSYAKEDIECKEEKFRTLRTSDARSVLMSVGRLVPEKGFAELIDVMPDVMQKHGNVILNIIGDGPERKALELKVKSLKLESNVFFKGQISKDEVFCELKNSDVFILNTRYEGLSHILLEAMDAGAPIITTNVCGNPEVIKDRETGFLIEVGDKNALKDKILKLIEDESLRTKLSENAKKSLAGFSKDAMIKKIFDVLNI